jgi:hypothetical protein
VIERDFEFLPDSREVHDRCSIKTGWSRSLILMPGAALYETIMEDDKKTIRGFT